MDTRNDLTLAGLPTDIIRIIVHMEQADTVDCMKLISPRWNTCALEFLSNRDRLPPIDNLSFYYGVPPRPHVLIQERYHHYFGLRTMEQSAEGFEKYACHMRHYSDDRIARIFRRASKIENLEISLEHLGSFPRWLGDVAIREMKLNNIHRSDQAVLINFLRSHKVDKVVANRIYVDSTNWIANFVKEAMVYISEINIISSILLSLNDLVRDLNSTGTLQASFSPSGFSFNSKLCVTKITKD